MKTILLFVSIAVACGLLFVNIYTSIVDAASWGHDLPNSIAAAREYFKVVNPGRFFRIFSPLNQGLALIVLVVFWRSAPKLRLTLGAALICYMVAEAMTFGYFYPRNEILFSTASLDDVALMDRTWSEWNAMNWIRSLFLLIGVAFSFLSLHKKYNRLLSGTVK